MMIDLWGAINNEEKEQNPSERLGSHNLLPSELPPESESSHKGQIDHGRQSYNCFLLVEKSFGATTTLMLRACTIVLHRLCKRNVRYDGC